VSHCIDSSDGDSSSHFADNTRNLCYQDQPVVVVVVVVSVVVVVVVVVVALVVVVVGDNGCW
jgi:hypothetical protein